MPNYQPMRETKVETLDFDTERERTLEASASASGSNSARALLQEEGSRTFTKPPRQVKGFVFTVPTTLRGVFHWIKSCDHESDSDSEDSCVRRQLEEEIEEKVKAKKNERSELEDEIRLINVRRADIVTKMEQKLSENDEQLKEVNSQIEEIDEQLKALEVKSKPHEHLVLPGPSSLHWVEGQIFSTISNIVIVTNIIVLFNEIGNKEAEQKYFWLDNGFMIFYCVELWLKWTLWRHMFLIGKFSDVWWHWLDLIIVVSGVLEMWLYPSLIATGALHKHGDTTWLRLLRLGRLARIIKILSAVLSQDLLWVEGPRFQLFIQGVIMVNSLIIALECDIPGFPGWIFIEHLMLGVFSFEVAARLKHWGCYAFFVKNVDDLVWNWLDFVIVFGGIIDQWLMPGIALVQVMIGMEPIEPSKLGHVMMLLRMARLLRILRLIRLIHSIPPLYTLIISITQALKGMLWVLVLSLIILYIFALLAVRLVSHGLVFGGTAPADVAEIFPNVPESIFVLFQVMNGDTEMLEPLFKALPCSQFIFMIFTVLSSWAILSILTAVVSEKMMKATLEYEMEEEAKKAEMDNRHTEEKLIAFFTEVDTDHDHKLSLEEWREVMTHREKKEHLQDATGLSENDIKDLFSYLSRADNVDKHGNPIIKVERKAFIRGCKKLKESVTEASIMRLEKQLWEVRKSIRDKIDKTAISKQSFDIHYDIDWQHRITDGLENMQIRFDGGMPSLTDTDRYLEEAHDAHGKVLYRRVGNGLEKNNLFKVGYTVELCLDPLKKSDLFTCNGYYQQIGYQNGRPRYRNTRGAYITFDKINGDAENVWQLKVHQDAVAAFIRVASPEDKPGELPTGRWDLLPQEFPKEKLGELPEDKPGELPEDKNGELPTPPEVITEYARVFEAAHGETAPEEKDFPITFTIVRNKADNEERESIDRLDRPWRQSTNSWFWPTDSSRTLKD